MLVTMGALGLFSAIKMGMSARHTAELYIRKADWDWKHGPPRWTKEDQLEEASHGSEVVTRDEFEMFDVIRNMALCMFFVALNTLVMGKCGKRLIKNQNANLARRMFKKAIFFLGLMSLVMFFNGNSKHMRGIIERNKTKPHHERHLQETDEELYRKPKGLITPDHDNSAAAPAEEEWDGRKEAYMMFAPKLWDKAKNEPSAQQEQHHKHHHGHHHGNHHRHHKKHCCGVCPLKIILLLTILAHIYNIKCVRDVLIQKEENKKALKAPAQKMKAQQAQVIYSQSIIPQMVFAPAPIPEQRVEQRESALNYALNESLVSVDISKISDADKSEN